MYGLSHCRNGMKWRRTPAPPEETDLFFQWSSTSLGNNFTFYAHNLVKTPRLWFHDLDPKRGFIRHPLKHHRKSSVNLFLDFRNNKALFPPFSTAFASYDPTPPFISVHENTTTFSLFCALFHSFGRIWVSFSKQRLLQNCGVRVWRLDGFGHLYHVKIQLAGGDKNSKNLIPPDKPPQTNQNHAN